MGWSSTPFTNKAQLSFPVNREGGRPPVAGRQGPSGLFHEARTVGSVPVRETGVTGFGQGPRSRTRPKPARKTLSSARLAVGARTCGNRPGVVLALLLRNAIRGGLVSCDRYDGLDRLQRKRPRHNPRTFGNADPS